MSTVRTYPVTRPHRIFTSPARALTEPASGGFMKSVMGCHDMDGVDDEGIIIPTPQQRKITQEEQDVIDEKARRRAMKNLVDSWQERLQLISVITTFFASTEAVMLTNTKPDRSDPGSWENNALKASNASFLGALIVHVYAAVLSFLGAFLLTRYKLKEATREEMRIEGMVNSPLGGSVFKDVERVPADLGLQQLFTNNDAQTMYNPVNDATTTSAPGQIKKKGSYRVEPPIISANPHLEQVGLFRSNVSSHLLSRTHALCVFLAAAGFILAIIGILCYAWATQPTEVSIFASVCFGAAVLAMVILLI
ncbi:hypothetical protein JVT61DRAFT_593 [Boletus reticuloceps]|uniref:Transmembrane protein n=1 Tax=Boletus reticuloceps TaxID=495285 RepID=A0A8I3AGV0_9AGAM|nr:hypothetical protein JVT61DRAFT_593 [Boletus reticuloceps]